MPTAETPATQPWWDRRLINYLLFVSLLLGLWWLLAGTNFGRAWAVMRDVRPVPLVLACAANLLSQVTRAVGWAVLLAGHRIPFPRLVRFEVTAQGASAVSPEGSGELIRLAQLQSQGVRASTTLSVIAVRKLLSSAALVPLLVLLLWAPPGLIPSWGAVVVAIYGLVMSVLIVALLAVARRLADVQEPGDAKREHMARLRRITHALHEGVAPLRHRRAAAASLGAALATRLLDVVAALLIMSALKIPVSPALAVFALLLVEISNVLPTAPGQLGSFDAAVLSASAGLLPNAEAVAFALTLHAQQVLPQAIAAAVVSLGATVRQRAIRPRGASGEGAQRG